MVCVIMTLISFPWILVKCNALVYVGSRCNVIFMAWVLVDMDSLRACRNSDLI